MDYQRAITVMRAQPPHAGHLALIRQGLATAEEVLVVLGSANAPRTPRNPFTATERQTMIQLALSTDERSRVRFEHVRDYYDRARWAQHVRSVGEAGLRTPSGVVLVGHDKDRTSDYLYDFPGWALQAAPRIGQLNATDIRNAMIDARHPYHALQAFNDALDPAVQDFLVAHLARPEWAGIRAERQKYLDEARTWGKTPYEVFKLCGDAVVRWGDEVLVLRRGTGIGEGLLAFPGGHAEPLDTALDAALRELDEETGIGLPRDELLRSMKDQAFRDHPYRSQRPGRVISMAYYFELRTAKRPPVHKVSDEATPEWIDIARLPAFEADFFEDHFMTGDHFLGLT